MTVAVAIPQQLRSYTDGAERVRVEATTIDAALRAVDERHPGLRFRVIDEQGRVRPHMRVFVNNVLARDIRAGVSPGDEIYLFGALSGG